MWRSLDLDSYSKDWSCSWWEVVKVSLDQGLPWPALCCRQGPPMGWTRRAGRWGQWREAGLIFLWDIPSSRQMCRPKPRARYGTRSWPSGFRYCFFITLSLPPAPATNRRGLCKGHEMEVRGGRGKGFCFIGARGSPGHMTVNLTWNEWGTSLVVQWLGLHAFFHCWWSGFDSSSGNEDLASASCAVKPKIKGNQ